MYMSPTKIQRESTFLRAVFGTEKERNAISAYFLPDLPNYISLQSSRACKLRVASRLRAAEREATIDSRYTCCFGGCTVWNCEMFSRSRASVFPCEAFAIISENKYHLYKRQYLNFRNIMSESKYVKRERERERKREIFWQH